MNPTPATPLTDRLALALAARRPMIEADGRHRAALRLLAGFHEGLPQLAVDLYADTLVLHNYADPPQDGDELARQALAYYRAALPWLRCAVVKPRHAAPEGAEEGGDGPPRRGEVLWGGPPAREITEAGVRYSVDLLGVRDTGFYLDTRALRAWLRERMAGRTLLNAFAYTGSLGVAALAGGAAEVLQLDASRAVLNVAKTSYTLNGFPIRKQGFVVSDFWEATGPMRRKGRTFDCVILDPPFFAAAATGTVDLARGYTSLINKVRPLVADGGALVAVNNALYLSGQDYLRDLEGLAADGYLEVEALLPVPPDVTGLPELRAAGPPADPAPFNHSTKIAVLRVRRKAG